MSRDFIRSAACFSRSVILLACYVFTSALHFSAAQAVNPSQAGPSAPAAPLQSDPAAAQAMEKVLVESGGAAVWRNLHSAEESFSVLTRGETAPHVIRLLDDWSLNTTRYRRRLEGQKTAPEDHNGVPSFSSAGNSQTSIPEFDQARTLVPRLPAAAAEVMLRRHEYSLKISSLQNCKADQICIDVFRNGGLPGAQIPEQQWKISATTGLPITVRYQMEMIGDSSVTWREIFFLKYANEDGITVPVLLGVSARGQRQTWSFVSLKPNPGFDPSTFDQETVR